MVNLKIFIIYFKIVANGIISVPLLIIMKNNIKYKYKVIRFVKNYFQKIEVFSIIFINKKTIITCHSQQDRTTLSILQKDTTLVLYIYEYNNSLVKSILNTFQIRYKKGIKYKYKYLAHVF